MDNQIPDKIKNYIVKAFCWPLKVAIPGFIICGAALVVCLINEDNLPEILRYPSYSLAAYSLTVLVVSVIQNGIPWLFEFGRELPIIGNVIGNIRYRQRFFLYIGGGISFLYLFFYFIVAFVYQSRWFYVIGLYNLCIAIIKGYLSRQEHRMHVGPKSDRIRIEGIATRNTSILLFVMNNVITIMGLLIVFNDETYKYHFIILYGIALYVFIRLIVIIVAVIQTKPHNTGIWKVVQLINLATANMSMFTFQTALLHNYEDDIYVREHYNAITGVLVFIINQGIVVWLYLKSRKVRSEAENIESESNSRA